MSLEEVVFISPGVVKMSRSKLVEWSISGTTGTPSILSLLPVTDVAAARIGCLKQSRALTGALFVKYQLKFRRGSACEKV